MLTNDAMNCIFYRTAHHSLKVFFLCFEDENAEAVDDSIVTIPQVVKHDRNVVVAEKCVNFLENKLLPLIVIT